MSSCLESARKAKVEMINELACSHCDVRHRALCGALGDEEIHLLSQISHRRHFDPGEQIIGEGEPAEFFAVILSGFIKLTKLLADGRQQIVGLQFSSDFIGRPFTETSPFFAEAGSAVELCCFDAKRFEALVKSHPTLGQRLLEGTLDELDAARNWMLLLGRKTAVERVASLLHLIADRARRVSCARCGPHDMVSFDLPLSRAEIGDYLGLTIETVSRQMTSLKRRGVIALEGSRRIVVSDVTQLAAASEQAA